MCAAEAPLCIDSTKVPGCNVDYYYCCTKYCSSLEGATPCPDDLECVSREGPAFEDVGYCGVP